MDTITEVWTVPAVMAAAASSLPFALYLWLVHLGPSRHAPRRGMAALIGVDVLMGAFLFTFGQVAASLWTGDDLWVRVVSRYGLWMPFAVALALTLYLALRSRGVR